MEAKTTPEKDPNTGRLYCLVAIDASEIVDLKQGMRKWKEGADFECPNCHTMMKIKRDEDDVNEMDRLTKIDNDIHEIWSKLKPS